MWNKIQKIYVGSQQVRPKVTYKDSYTFVDKTVSQIQSDGWVQWQNTPSINSYWYCSAWNNQSTSYKTIQALWDAIANAKKITLSSEMYIYGSWWFATRLFNYPNRQYATGILMYWTGRQYQRWWTSTEVSWSFNWTYTTKTVVDLVNKTVTYSITWTTDVTYNLSDTEVANIKTINTWEVSGSNTVAWVKSVSILVE